ncbi:MAG: hypothetical protein HZB18_04780 [Chloroflexi bacterium]|nr:hypothetical protein [Chloroflexota bacterium]
MFRAPAETSTMIKSLPEFKLDAYADIAPIELVVFALYALQDNGHYAATEEIVSACFRLFPHRFSLKNYFYWPDSALIMQYLNEAKEKGDLKGKPADGFAVKVQGRQTVKRVAKILGVTLPAPEKKVKKPAPVIKKVEVIQTAKPKMKKKVIAPQKKKSAAPVAKKQAARPAKKTLPSKAKIAPQPAPLKQAVLPQVKIKPKRKEQVKPIASVPVKKTPAPKKEKPQKQVPVKNVQPAQLTMALPVVQEKKARPAPPVVKKVEPKPVKAEKGIAPTVAIKVSKEEKVKAGKVVHLMERSDAYRQYKRTGGKSRISEFDFRSLLLCTMESSPETLARNVNTFKSYANIQNRQDLVTFLNFVEHGFSALLNSSGKKLAKKR